jgi:acyl carrier protein
MASESSSYVDIERRVISVLADYTSARVPVPLPQSHIVDDLGIDSLEMLAAITSLESEFNFRIPDDIFSEIYTVRELSEFIEKRLGAINGAVNGIGEAIG